MTRLQAAKALARSTGHRFSPRLQPAGSPPFTAAESPARAKLPPGKRRGPGQPSAVKPGPVEASGRPRVSGGQRVPDGCRGTPDAERDAPQDPAVSQGVIPRW
jgi:hypothetical protein